MNRFAALFIAIFGLSQPIAADVILSKDEIAQTLSYGPWPLNFEKDPSNIASGNPDAIAMGKALFFDPSLSSDGTLSCASCHDSAQDFTDGRARAEGRALLDRNTQSLWNLRAYRWFGWAGASDSLWAHNIRPLLNRDEMGQSFEGVRDTLLSHEVRETFTAIFGDPKVMSAERVTVNVAKSLAAYLETLNTGETSFDRFRAALEAQDWTKAADYPIAAQRGLQIFIGTGRCSFCHSGPAFTNSEFHDAGVPYFIDQGRVDEGRFGAIKELRKNPFTLAGPYSDDPDKTGAWAVNTLRFQHSDFGIFRTPSLRGAAKTAPYMHDGSLTDLRDVLDHYNEINMDRLHSDGEAILRPLELSDAQLDDLETFLRTLSDDK